MTNSTGELDDKMRWLKNFERLLEIQRNIVWPSILEMEPKVSQISNSLSLKCAAQEWELTAAVSKKINFIYLVLV